MAANTDEIKRRWNAPPQWGYIKRRTDELWIDGNSVFEGIEEGLTQETFDRIRHGYMCIKCKEPHEQPFPVQCSLCGFPIKDQQRRYLQLLDRGEARLGVDYGPSVQLRDEVDRLDAELEEDEWKEHPTLGIVVPRGV